MQRTCIKGTGVRCRNNPKDEPDFYNMQPVSGNTMNSTQSEAQIQTITQSQPQIQTQAQPQIQTQIPLAIHLPMTSVPSSTAINTIAPITVSAPSLQQPQMVLSHAVMALGNSIAISPTAIPVTTSTTRSNKIAADVVVDFEGMHFHLMDEQSSSLDNNNMVVTVPSWQEEINSFPENVVSRQQTISLTPTVVTLPIANHIISSSFPRVEVVSDEDDDVRFGELLKKVAFQQ